MAADDEVAIHAAGDEAQKEDAAKATTAEVASAEPGAGGKAPLEAAPDQGAAAAPAAAAVPPQYTVQQAAEATARQRAAAARQQQQLQQGMTRGDMYLIAILVLIVLFFIGFVAYHFDAPLPWSWIGLGPPEHELTKRTWAEKTEGKDVFVKFYAPWCGHCKSMAADWDKLRQDHINSSSVEIASVDCIGHGRSLCQEVGIKSFPTLKYGDPTDFQGLIDYKGGRTYKALAAFAAGNFGPKCGPGHLDLCTQEEKVRVRELVRLGASRLQELVDEKVAEVRAIENAFKEVKDAMGEGYNKANAEKETKRLNMKGPLDLLRMVIKMEPAPSAESAPRAEL